MDDALREAEQAWRRTGGADELARLLAALVRARRIPLEHVRLAATLGHEPARAAFGAVAPERPPIDALGKDVNVGREVRLRLLDALHDLPAVATLVTALALHPPEREGPVDEELLAAARASLADAELGHEPLRQALDRAHGLRSMTLARDIAWLALMVGRAGAASWKASGLRLPMQAFARATRGADPRVAWGLARDALVGWLLGPHA